jgi:hypothetical protein
MAFLHISLIKKYFSVFPSVFDKTRQKQKSKHIKTNQMKTNQNKIRTLLHLETSEVCFECQKSQKM